MTKRREIAQFVLFALAGCASDLNVNVEVPEVEGARTLVIIEEKQINDELSEFETFVMDLSVDTVELPDALRGKRDSFVPRYTLAYFDEGLVALKLKAGPQGDPNQSLDSVHELALELDGDPRYFEMIVEDESASFVPTTQGDLRPALRERWLLTQNKPCIDVDDLDIQNVPLGLPHDGRAAAALLDGSVIVGLGGYDTPEDQAIRLGSQHLYLIELVDGAPVVTEIYQEDGLPHKGPFYYDLRSIIVDETRPNSLLFVGSHGEVWTAELDRGSPPRLINPALHSVASSAETHPNVKAACDGVAPENIIDCSNRIAGCELEMPRTCPWKDYAAGRFIDGKIEALYSMEVDGTIQHFDNAEWECLARACVEDSGQPAAMAYDAENRDLYAAGGNGRALFRARGREISQVLQFREAVTGIESFRKSGVVIGGGEGTMRFLESEAEVKLEDFTLALSFVEVVHPQDGRTGFLIGGRYGAIKQWWPGEASCAPAAVSIDHVRYLLPLGDGVLAFGKPSAQGRENVAVFLRLAAVE